MHGTRLSCGWEQFPPPLQKKKRILEICVGGTRASWYTIRFAFTKALFWRCERRESFPHAKFTFYDDGSAASLRLKPSVRNEDLRRIYPSLSFQLKCGHLPYRLQPPTGNVGNLYSAEAAVIPCGRQYEWTIRFSQHDWLRDTHPRFAVSKRFVLAKIWSFMWFLCFCFPSEVIQMK